MLESFQKRRGTAEKQHRNRKEIEKKQKTNEIEGNQENMMG